MIKNNYFMKIGKFNLLSLLFVAVLFTWTSCDDDDKVLPERDSGELRIEITDAPVDDPLVKAVYITVSDLKINGSSFPEFTKKKINLLELQDGKTETLGLTGIEVGSYDEISLVLEGNSAEAATYVEDVNGEAHALLEESVTLNKSFKFDVEKDSTIRLVIDFDLRKALTRTSDSLNLYQFTEADLLVEALRVVDLDEAGKLNGQVNNAGNNDQVIAFLYKKGKFDESRETELNSDSLRFAGAETSAVVRSDGNYVFPYLNPGDYELHFASFSHDAEEGRVVFEGLLDTEVAGGFDLLDISIEADTETTINLSLGDLLPL